MRFRISYIKNDNPLNKITNVNVSCKTVREALETAKMNMGSNDMACVYYGNNFEKLQLVYPTDEKHFTELYGKKTKEQIGTCMGKPIYGWGMRFYKDKDCNNLASIDPYHYIRKDQTIIMGGVKVYVHVVK